MMFVSPSVCPAGHKQQLAQENPNSSKSVRYEKQNKNNQKESQNKNNQNESKNKNNQNKNKNKNTQNKNQHKKNQNESQNKNHKIKNPLARRNLKLMFASTVLVGAHAKDRTMKFALTKDFGGDNANTGNNPLVDMSFPATRDALPPRHFAKYYGAQVGADADYDKDANKVTYKSMNEEIYRKFGGWINKWYKDEIKALANKKADPIYCMLKSEEEIHRRWHNSYYRNTWIPDSVANLPTKQNELDAKYKDYMTKRIEFLGGKHTSMTAAYKTAVNEIKEDIKGGTNAFDDPREANVVDPNKIPRKWKKDDKSKVDGRRKGNKDSIIHMQYNILALGLTETGGFGNSLPPCASSAFDNDGFQLVLKQYELDKKIKKEGNVKWGGKKASPALLWLNDEANRFQRSQDHSYPHWNRVRDEILNNWVLKMDKLMCEITETEADIITMQEVDTFNAKGVYSLKDRMEKIGYAGVHRPKPDNGNGLFGFVDGPAIFWDAGKFEEVGHVDPIYFEDSGKSDKYKKAMEEAKDDEGDREKVLYDYATNPEGKYCAQIGIIVKLRNRFSGETFHVVSAHMKSDGGVKEHTDKLKKVVEELPGRVICGIDFNSKPGKSLGKRPDKTMSELTYLLSKSNGKELKTAHKEVAGAHLVSTWQRRCCGEQGNKIKTRTKKLRPHSKQIDHSFYRGFKPLNAMVFTDEEHIENKFRAGGLPCAGNSSDHVYVCIEYELDGKSSNGSPSEPTWFGWMKSPLFYVPAIMGGTALAVAGKPWWYNMISPQKEVSFTETAKKNPIKTFLCCVTVIPAAVYGLYCGYYTLMDYFYGSEDDSTEGSSRSSSIWGRGRGGKKPPKKNKGSSGTFVIVVVVILLVLIVAGVGIFFAMQGNSDSELDFDGEALEGDELV